jgi:hypothetical protein
MEFFIKKNATLPILLMQVVKDGRADYHSFMDELETATIVFSMVDETTGIAKIANRAAYIVEKVFLEPNASPEYYIYYKFTDRDTNRVGRFKGEFMITNDEGRLIVPLREELYINVIDSVISTTYCC